MKTDPIIDELHRIRDEHAKKFKYDVHAICEDIRRKEKESGRTFVSFDQSEVRESDSAKQPAKTN